MVKGYRTRRLEEQGNEMGRFVESEENILHSRGQIFIICHLQVSQFGPYLHSSHTAVSERKLMGPPSLQYPCPTLLPLWPSQCPHLIHTALATGVSCSLNTPGTFPSQCLYTCCFLCPFCQVPVTYFLNYFLWELTQHHRSPYYPLLFGFSLQITLLPTWTKYFTYFSLMTVFPNQKISPMKAKIFV